MKKQLIRPDQDFKVTLDGKDITERVLLIELADEPDIEQILDDALAEAGVPMLVEPQHWPHP